jgi:hypothetical protein
MEGTGHEKITRQESQQEDNQQWIVETLGLMPLSPDDSNQQDSRLYKVELPEVSDKERIFDVNLLQEIFSGYELKQSESVIRGKGDTTLFTTSGIQRVESMLHGLMPLEKEPFIVYQPVLRSQYIDFANEGSSSSFTNITLACIAAERKDFHNSCEQALQLLAELGFTSDDVEVKIEEEEAAWGDRTFKNTSLTLTCRGVEIGECIYSQDFPFSDTEKGNIVDFGIGLERLLWSQKNTTTPFLSAHLSTYDSLEEKGLSRDRIASIVDAVRSMTLIALEGVTPSNKNQGYRFRQLSKRFVSRSLGISSDAEEIIRSSYEEWTKYGHTARRKLDEVIEMVSVENDRNHNRKILDYLKEKHGMDFDVNINQSAEQFLDQLSFSINRQELDGLIENISYEE